MSKFFYYIPPGLRAERAQEIREHLEGLEGFLKEDGQGAIIWPNSRAHVRCCLLGIELLKGIWQDIEEC